MSGERERKREREREREKEVRKEGGGMELSRLRSLLEILGPYFAFQGRYLLQCIREVVLQKQKNEMEILYTRDFQPLFMHIQNIFSCAHNH